MKKRRRRDISGIVHGPMFLANGHEKMFCLPSARGERYAMRADLVVYWPPLQDLAWISPRRRLA